MIREYVGGSYASDSLGGKKGQKKRTQSPTQARHWFSEALFELILAKSENQYLEIALGLPKFPSYVNLLNRTKWLRERIGLLCYLASEEGPIEFISPDDSAHV